MNKRQRTNQRILECAREAFLEKGYHGADIGYIASLVGIDKRTIYRYYESKEALAFAIWTQVIDTMMGVGHDAEGSTGYDRLKATLDLYIGTVLSNKDIVRFIGEFDHIFSGEYPDIPEAHEFVKHIRNNQSAIAQHVVAGYEDKSIRQDIDCLLISNTISNIIIALSERIIIRGEHLRIEQGHSEEVLYQAIEMILLSIKA